MTQDQMDVFLEEVSSLASVDVLMRSMGLKTIGDYVSDDPELAGFFRALADAIEHKDDPTA